MVEASPTSSRKPPKGAPPKGGTRFPRYGLKEAIEWARKLVSKTHNGPQVADIIYASVIDSKGPRGEIKASALKQYNLMEGPKDAYTATSLAKSIASTPKEELAPLLGQAALSPGLFKSLFDTFHGDSVTTAKLRQRAAELNVHPDNLDAAISIYVSSLTIAQLVTIDGDKIQHRRAGDLEGTRVSEENDESIQDTEEETGEDRPPAPERDTISKSPRAIFNVTVNLDATLDSEKLEKQLALLKRYGAI
jgi:hypothetical protein